MPRILSRKLNKRNSAPDFRLVRKNSRPSFSASRNDPFTLTRPSAQTHISYDNETDRVSQQMEKTPTPSLANTSISSSLSSKEFITTKEGAESSPQTHGRDRKSYYRSGSMPTKTPHASLSFHSGTQMMQKMRLKRNDSWGQFVDVSEEDVHQKYGRFLVTPSSTQYSRAMRMRKVTRS